MDAFDAVQDLKNDLHRHQDEDRVDFADVRTRIEGVRSDVGALKELISQWSGALGLAKWSLGLGIPAILGAAVTHVVRHW